MSSKSGVGLGVVIRSALDRLEASKLARMQTSEIVGAVTVACLLLVLIVLRWLSV